MKTFSGEWRHLLLISMLGDKAENTSLKKSSGISFYCATGKLIEKLGL